MLPELVAEFLGTLVLVLFGNGVVAMVALFGSGVPGEIVHGGYTNIAIAWGLGTTMGIYIAGRMSGAHLNPAVSISLAIHRDFPWRKVAPYAAAQTLGAFIASALIFWNYRPAFQAIDPALDHTANVFTTFPTFPQVPFAGLLDQTLGTALFMLVLLAITEEHGPLSGRNFSALMAGLLVVALSAAFGGIHGYALNPARDFGPRLFTVFAGFKNNGLSDGPLVFWVPIAGPILGGVLGAAAYDYGIRRFLPSSD